MPPQHVLIADDEPALLRLLSRVLERSGRSVTAVETGDAAIERLSAGAPAIDLLVVDAGIRPEGVIPVLEAVQPGASQVIVISGKGLEPDELALLEHCRGRFLAKPFSPEGLLAVVDGA